jgi:UDP-N-acetylglucosamine:LPS N-acetylglucosamine transferase
MLTASGYQVIEGTYSEPPYADLDLVVCRPGMGTVTACVGACLPMVLVYEPDLELAHNASHVAQLGVGLDCGSEPVPEAVSSAVEAALDEDTYRTMSRTMHRLPRDGLGRAADWLLGRFS